METRMEAPPTAVQETDELGRSQWPLASWYAEASGGRWIGRPPGGDVVVRGAGIDTRDELAAKAFVALRGARRDGHDHLADAAAGGAAMVVVSAEQAERRRVEVPAAVPMLVVADPRTARTK